MRSRTAIVSAVVIIFALAAAAFYGSSAAFEQHAVAASQDARVLRRALGLVTDRWWLLGKAANVLAVAFQAVALAKGPLVAIQAVLSTGLFFALAVGALMGRRRLAGVVIAAALVLGIGITILLAVGRPHGAHGQPPDRAWLAVSSVAAAAALACALAGRRFGPAPRAALLGAAAGITFALDSAFLKSVAREVGRRGVVDGLVRWQTVALVVAALAGELLVQLAFAAHTLQASMPALTAGEPLAAVGIGMVLFRERFVTNGWAPLWELFAAALIIGGVIVLTAAEGRAEADASRVASGGRAPPL